MINQLINQSIYFHFNSEYVNSTITQQVWNMKLSKQLQAIFVNIINDWYSLHTQLNIKYKSDEKSLEKLKKDHTLTYLHIDKLLITSNNNLTYTPWAHKAY